MRTIVQQMSDVRATPLETAVMAAPRGRYPASAHDAVNSGSGISRIPTMTGVTSARTPSRRITRQGYERALAGPTDRTYQRPRLVVRRTRCEESTLGTGASRRSRRTGFRRGPAAILRRSATERAGPREPGGQRSREQGASAAADGDRATRSPRSAGRPAEPRQRRNLPNTPDAGGVLVCGRVAP